MAGLTPSDLDAEAVRSAAERVLSSATFEPVRPGVIERALTAAGDVVAQVLDTLVSPAGSGIGIGLLAAAVTLVGLIAWRLARRVRRDRGRPPTPGALAGRSARAWELEADRHAADGAWAEALRCHYRALLADLVAAGTIDEVAGRTARGYLREVATAAPRAADAMTAVTEAFEAAWYDRRDVTPTDVTELRAATAAVRRHVMVRA